MNRPEYPTVALTPDTRRILNSIMSRDPDGGDIEPTPAAYDAHRRWAVEAYGQAMWDRYCAGNWIETREV